MKRTVITYGLISGAVVSTIMAVSMIICHNNPNYETGPWSMVVGYLSMLIAFSMIYVGVKTYRDQYNNGLISFGKAFRMGLVITLIASTMYVIVWALVYNLVMPDFMDKYGARMLEQAKNASPEELRQKTAELAKYREWYKNPVFFALFTYLEILPVGLLVSLITALILKRNRHREEIVPAV